MTEDGDEFEWTDDEIRERAYSRWEARGKPEGDPDRDWHEAKVELDELRTLDRRRP